MFRVLKDNGYPANFLPNCCKPVTSSRNISVYKLSTAGSAFVPYIRDVTEPIRRILPSYNGKVAQKRIQALEHIFSKPKDCVPKEQRTGSVYSIPCKDCEHENTSYKQAHQTDHTVGWNNSEMITTNRWYHQCLRLDAWNINFAHAPLNRNDSGLLRDTYLHLELVDKNKRSLVSAEKDSCDDFRYIHTYNFI